MSKKATTGNLAQLNLRIDECTPEFLLALVGAGNKPILWGQVGIGKTDVGTELAVLLTKMARAKDPNHPGYEFRSKVVANLPPEDITGLPIIDRESRTTVSTRPDFMGKPGVRYVLLLDEFNRAPAAYRNSLLSFVLSGKLGDHEMHPDSVILLAGNAGSHDVVGLQRLGYADRNRLIHVNIVNTFDSWSKWASTHKIHPVVLGFLGTNEARLYTDPTEASNEAFATPRSWAAASKLLDNPYFLREHEGAFNISSPERRNQLAVALNGTVGAVAAELMVYLEVVSRLPNPQRILDEAWFPKEGDDIGGGNKADFGVQYASMATVCSWLSRKRIDTSDAKPENHKASPLNFNEERWLKFVELCRKYEAAGRGELRACAIKLLFRGLGYLFPNRQGDETNPTVAESFCGEKGSKGHKAVRDLYKEIISYLK